MGKRVNEDRVPNGSRKLGWMVAAAVAALLPAPAALAAGGGGGGNACPWAQDVTLDLGGKSLTVPQSVFDPKNPSPVVDGYELRPRIETLTLDIIGPGGMVWQAALTRIAGGKRCTAFYVGRPTLVEDEESPASRVAER